METPWEIPGERDASSPDGSPENADKIQEERKPAGVIVGPQRVSAPAVFTYIDGILSVHCENPDILALIQMMRRQDGVFLFAHPDAPWIKNPLTEKQADQLRRKLKSSLYGIEKKCKEIGLEIPESLHTKINIWLAAIKKEVFSDLLADGGKPGLVIIPPISPLELMARIKGTENRSEGGVFRDIWSDYGTEWRVGIGDFSEVSGREIFELKKEKEEAEKEDYTLEKWVGLYRESFAKRGLSMMPKEAYPAAVLSALTQDWNLDAESGPERQSSFTAFEEDPRAPYYIPVAGQETLSTLPDDVTISDLHCRKWIGMPPGPLRLV